MSVPPQPDHQLEDLENLTDAQLPNDVIAKIIPFLRDDTDNLAIFSLPQEILQKVISFLPHSPREATARELKRVHKSLALARLHPRFATSFIQHSSVVKYIDPFPSIQHTQPLANMPPYAEPQFLCLLVLISPGLYSLRAPSVKQVLGYVGNQLKELSFIDDGLRFDDLRFFSRSSLTIVTVTNPSRVVLSALAKIKTLKRVSLLNISSDTVSSAETFLNATKASYLLLDLSSTQEQDLYCLVHHLPPLQTFVLKCQVRHAWNALNYLRVVAKEIVNVYMIVDGVRIAVQKNGISHNSDNGQWEASIWQRLICRKDIRMKPKGQVWPRGMSLTELDLDLLEEIYKHQPCRREELDNHFLNCSETAPVDFELIIRLGRKLPSRQQAIVRASWIKQSRCSELATSLVISQDLVRYAGRECDHWVHDFLKTVLSKFTNISTLRICKPSHSRKVSGKFIMALGDFLETVTAKHTHLKTVYLEDAGDLVLQKRGIPVLTDERTLKETLRQVILCVKEKESISKIEMGTIIAQLEIWASKKLKVDPTVVKDESVE